GDARAGAARRSTSPWSDGPGAAPGLIGQSVREPRARLRYGLRLGGPRLGGLVGLNRSFLPIGHQPPRAERTERGIFRLRDLALLDVERVVTRRHVAAWILGQRRFDRFADVRGTWAAGVEAAPRRRLDRVGWLAADHHPLARAVLLRIRNRNRGQERLGVWVDRLGVELLGGRE